MGKSFDVLHSVDVTVHQKIKQGSVYGRMEASAKLSQEQGNKIKLHFCVWVCFGCFGFF